jgi:hypothetical protein
MGPEVRQRGSVIPAQRARVHLVYRLTGRIIEALAASRSGSVRRVVVKAQAIKSEPKTTAWQTFGAVRCGEVEADPQQSPRGRQPS